MGLHASTVRRRRRCTTLDHVQFEQGARAGALAEQRVVRAKNTPIHAQALAIHRNCGCRLNPPEQQMHRVCGHDLKRVNDTTEKLDPDDIRGMAAPPRRGVRS